MGWSRRRIGMKRLIGLLICTAMVAACGSEPATTRAMAEPGEPAPVSAEELGALVEGNGDFAFRLYRAVAGDQNLVVSPHSIATALTMTYAGARGVTAEEMRTALGLILPGLHDPLGPWRVGQEAPRRARAGGRGRG
jgi:serine protease inhibitor